MLDYATKVSPPSDDDRWKIVDTRMRRHGFQPDALIEVLHSVQETFGYISGEALRYVALSLKLPFSKVYGVASFYHFFSLTPPGEHTCVVCTGTACYLKGAPALLEAIERKSGIRPDEISWDRNLSLLTVRCLGACSAAPIVIVDNGVDGKVTVSQLVDRLDSLALPTPSSGGDA